METKIAVPHLENCSVASVEVWEPNGPVSVLLITLTNGSVIGVNGECTVLYPSREFFENSGDYSVANSEECPAFDNEHFYHPETRCPECARSHGPHYQGECNHD